MLIAYSKKHEIEVYIETITESGVVASPINTNCDEKILTTVDDLEVTRKLQQGYSEVTNGLQQGYAQVTAKLRSGYNQGTALQAEDTPRLQANSSKNEQLSGARKHLPAPGTLLDELNVKWPVVASLMDKRLYAEAQSAASFQELAQHFASGKLKNVPKPVYRAAETENQTNYSLKFYNRTMQLYVRYSQENKTQGWFLWVDLLLEKTDKLLTKIIS